MPQESGAEDKLIPTYIGTYSYIVPTVDVSYSRTYVWNMYHNFYHLLVYVLTGDIHTGTYYYLAEFVV